MWSNSTPTSSRAQMDEECEPSAKKAKMKKNSWSDKNMSDAIAACSNHEVGIEEASAIYNVPKRSLRTQIKEKNISPIDEEYKVFVLPMIPSSAEEDLVAILRDLINGQFTVSPIEIRRLGYEIASEKYFLNNLPLEKDCLLGNRWYKNFISKHPHLDTYDKNMQQSDPSYNQTKSREFFSSLEVLIKRHKIDGSGLYSVDGIELKFRASNQDDFDRFHKRHLIHTNARTICCLSPAGTFIPPMFIKQNSNNEQTITLSLENDDLDNSRQFSNIRNETLTNSSNHNEYRLNNATYSHSSSNMNIKPSAEDIANIKKQIKAHLNKKHFPLSEENEEELREKLHEQFNQFKNKMMKKYENVVNKISEDVFYTWLQHFVSLVKPNIQQKIILLVHQQNCVKTFRTLQCAAMNGIIFLALPPHSIHKIHPLDGFTMALNRNLSTSASTWYAKNSNIKAQQVPLNQIFKQAFDESTNITIAKNGFLYSGIWPVNRTVFDSKELGGESILKQKDISITNSPDNVNQFRNDLRSYSNNYGNMVGDPKLDSQQQQQMQQQGAFYNPGFPEITSDFDMNKLCRVCMKEKSYMKSLFEPPPAISFHCKKMMDLTLIQIFPGDKLPEQICQYCLVQLFDAHKIRNQAIYAHSKLQKLKATIQELATNKRKPNERILLSSFQLESNNHSKSSDREVTANFDINSVCRICMEEKSLMTSIFYKPNSKSTPYVDTFSKIMDVAHLPVHAQDGLSSVICPFCRAGINQASEFIQRVLSSDARLREILAQLGQLKKDMPQTEQF